MVALGMAGFVVGFALGLRFRVLVLLPFEMAALVATAVIVITGYESCLVALLGFLTVSIACQIGYAISLSLPVLWRIRL
jgi:hypothetical protein